MSADIKEVERELGDFQNGYAEAQRDIESLKAELALRDQRISALEAENLRLRGIDPAVDIQELWQKELPYLFRSWSAMRDEVARTREALSRSELGEVWIWSTGDPEDGDNADTIICPILIQAEAFRGLQSELAALRRAKEEVWEQAIYLVETTAVYPKSKVLDIASSEVRAGIRDALIAARQSREE